MDVRCLRCGAVSTPETAAGRCPHCSYNLQAPLAKLRLVVGKLAGPIALFAYGLFIVHSNGPNSELFVGGSLAWAWSVYTQKSHRWLHKPITALDLEQQSPQSHPVTTPSFPMRTEGPVEITEPKIVKDTVPLSKPAMPDSWRQLAMVPRPRVLSTQASNREAVMVIGIFIAIGLVFARELWNEFTAVPQHPSQGFFELLLPAFFVYFAIDFTREARQEREVFREGELTTGVITNWTDENRGGTSVTYQFWTGAGQRFEGYGTLVAKEDLNIQQEPLKVFYLPQNPAKNVALCCTALRIQA